MKKTIITFAVLSITISSVFAQIPTERNNNDNLAFGNSRNRNLDNDHYSEGRNNRDWSYDSNWNVIKGSKGINSFQRQAKERIALGRSRGLITSYEASKLMNYYEKIERKENLFARNGRISRREANELERDLINLDKMITRETVDRNRTKNKRRF